MAVYFHISHETFTNGNLAPGLTISLTKPFKGPSSPPPDDVVYWENVERTVNADHPEGVSYWGEKFYLNLMDDEFMLERERYCEVVRRSQFPQMLSRLQGFFACESLKDAVEYRDRFKRSDAEIWEVEHDGRSHRLDMRWMRPCSEHEMKRNVLQYWSDKETESPTWEILMLPPVQVLRQIDV